MMERDFVASRQPLASVLRRFRRLSFFLKSALLEGAFNLVNLAQLGEKYTEVPAKYFTRREWRLYS